MFVKNSATVACCGSAPNECKCGGHGQSVENANGISTMNLNDDFWAGEFNPEVKQAQNEAAKAYREQQKYAHLNVANAADDDDDSKPAGGSLAAATLVWNYDPAETGR